MSWIKVDGCCRSCYDVDVAERPSNERSVGATTGIYPRVEVLRSPRSGGFLLPGGV